MKRRQWIRYTGYGLLGTLLTGNYLNSSPVLAQKRSAVTINWLGHSCFVFSNQQARILVNPFTPLGCTAKYREPKPSVDIVMISSRLLDEGSAVGLPNNPQLMVEPGVYIVKGIEFQGIKTLHDRENGRRFGDNTVWKWNQGGFKIVHLGGIASKIGIEQKILMGSPDILVIPVGGSPKAYNAEEAISAINVLEPRIVIPTQYLTNAAEEGECELEKVEQFIQLAKTEKFAVQRIKSSRLTITPKSFPSKGTTVRVFNDQNLIVKS